MKPFYWADHHQMTVRVVFSPDLGQCSAVQPWARVVERMPSGKNFDLRVNCGELFLTFEEARAALKSRVTRHYMAELDAINALTEPSTTA